MCSPVVFRDPTRQSPSRASSPRPYCLQISHFPSKQTQNLPKKPHFRAECHYAARYHCPGAVTMSPTETPLGDTEPVSRDSTPPRLPATNTDDDPAADGPEEPVDHGDEKRIKDGVQPLDPEVPNDNERQADTGPSEAEVINLQGTDNTPKEPKELNADSARNAKPANDPQPTTAPPTDLGPREPSAVPSQGSSVGSIKLRADTADDAVDGKTDHKDEVEDSAG